MRVAGETLPGFLGDDQSYRVRECHHWCHHITNPIGVSMSYSMTIGAGKDAMHVSFYFKVASSKAERGTFLCTVTCKRWISPTNRKGRLRKSSGISVQRKFILKGGKVSEKAPNAEEIRRSLEAVVSRIRRVFDDHMHSRLHDDVVLRKSKVEEIISSRDVFCGDDSTFVTRTTNARGARGVEYGGFVRRFMDEYLTSDMRTYAESPSALANIRTMAFNLHAFSLQYYHGKLSVHDLADPDRAPILANKLIRFLTEEADHPKVDSTVDNILTRLRTALSWAHRKGIVRNLDLTPYYFNAARQPKITLGIADFHSVALHQFTKGEERLERARDLWVFLCLTALRYKDSQRLPNLNPDDKVFTMSTSKTGKRVTIPIFSMTADLIRKYPEGLPRLSNQKLNKYIKEVLEVVGLTQIVHIPVVRGGIETTTEARLCDVITAHTGRRQFITIARSSGIPDAIIREVSGHANLDEIDTYTHVPRETIVSEFSMLNNVLGRLSL